MTHATRLRIGAGLAALAALGLLLAAPAGQAVGDVEVGSWWQGGSAGRPPPHVAEGGAWVSGSPSGPSAYSAVRFKLAASESRPLLTLRVKQATPPEVGGIKACPATSSWVEGTARAWAERPDYDCTSGAVIGQWSADGETILLDLSASEATHFDLVLVPDIGRGAAPAPPIGVPQVPGAPAPEPVFDLSFEPTSPGDIEVYRAPPGEAPTFRPATETAFDDPIPPALPTASLESTPAPPSEATATTTAPSAPPVALPSLPASSSEPGRLDRILAATVFALLAFWWWRLSFHAPVSPGPRISLHDDPAAIAALQPPVTTARVGRVPTLR